MAIINIKNFGKVTVSDPFARQIKDDWSKMKQGLFPAATVVEIGEFTGMLSDVTGFMIEPERRYDKQIGIDGEKPLPHDEASKRIRSIGDLLRNK